MQRRLSLLSMVVVLGCSPNLTPPEDAVITCESDADCPGGRRCNLTREVCELRIGNLPPTLGVDTPSASLRPTSTVAVTLTVSDPNGAPEGTDNLNVSARFSLDGTNWCNAGDGLSALASQASGSSETLVWNALQDAQCLADSTCSSTLMCDQTTTLPVVTLDLDDDGTPETDQLGFIPAIYLELQATDSGGLTSPEARTEPFALGNNPPTASLDLPGGQYSGRITVPFRITDDASDSAEAELEFRLPTDPMDTWRPLSVAQGSTRELGTQPSATAEPFLIVWDSLAESTIGATNITGLEIRIRAGDRVEGDQLQWGAWSSPTAIDIVNQNLPRAEQLVAVNAPGAEASGGIHLSYYLIDEESDLVDVRVEFSIDSGASWLTCTELPRVQSEGTRGLTTAPTSVSGQSGSRHFFTWDSLPDIGAFTRRVLLRVVAADDAGVGGGAQTALGPTVGRNAALDDGWSFQSTGVVSFDDISSKLLTGDFDGDGLLDMAYLNDTASTTPAYIHVQYGDSASRGNGPLVNPTSESLPFDLSDDFAIADFNEDGADDVVIRSRDSGSPVLSIMEGQVGLRSLNPGATFGAVSADGEVDVGDVNGDNHVDVVALDNAGALHVHLGDGFGAFGSASTVSLPTFGLEGFRLAAGDFDGDGRDDIAFAARETSSGEDGLWYQRSAGTTATVSLDNPVLLQGGLIAGVEPSVFFNMWLDSGDVNGDGDDDLLLTEAGNQAPRFFLFLGNATGPALADSQPITGLPGSVQIVDWDGDGFEDLALWLETPQRLLSIWKAKFSDGQVRSQEIASITIPEFDSSPQLADLNADGLSDVLTRYFDASSDYQTFLTGPQGAQFPSPLVAAGSTFTFSGQDDFVGADFDGDLVTDLMSVASDANFAALHRSSSVRGAGLGSLAAMASETFPFPSPPSDDTYMAIGDWNADGWLDAAALDSEAGIVSIIQAESTSGLQSWGFQPPFNYDEGVLFTILDSAGDFNGDGFDDLYMDDPEIWTADQSSGVWQSNFTPQSSVSGSPTFKAEAVDLDLDGNLDVVGNGGNDFRIAYGDGAGEFSQTCNVATGEPTRMARTADFNGDGIVDVVVALSPTIATGNIQVYLGNGSRCSFSEQVFSIPAIPSRPSNISVMDMDGDGITDVVVSSIGGPNPAVPGVYIWRGLGQDGLGDGTFGPPEPISNTTTVGHWLADYNSDGIMDVLAFSLLTSSLELTVGQRIDPWRSWSFQAGVESVSGTDIVLNQGAPGALGAADRFGDAISYRVARRRFVSHRPGFRRPDPARNGFAAALRENGFRTQLLGVDQLTAAWEFDGNLIAVPSTTSLGRSEVRSRYTDTGVPKLEASAPSTSFVVELPIVPRWDGTPLTSGDVRVFARLADWTRADEWPDDALFGDSAGESLLPMVSTAGAPRSLYIPKYEWVEVSADLGGDLSAPGAARRFILSGVGTTSPVVRIRTDALGVFEAFYAP